MAICLGEECTRDAAVLGKWCRKCYVVPSRRSRCSECGRVMQRDLRKTHARAQVCRRCKPVLPGVTSRPATCAYCREEFTSRRTRSGDSVRWTECCSRWCARRRELEAGVHPLAVDAEPIPLEERVEARKFAQSLSVRDKHRLRVNRRRVALLDIEREPYTRTEIAKRDGYQCQLCGQPVDMAVAYPDARSASIDHVVPISKGGDDTRKNVRLAHLGCNHARGNRV